MSPTSERWCASRTADGSYTLVDARLGQACHSSAGAWTESVERYAHATRLRERAALILAKGSEPRPLRLLDIGTGIAWNLAAASAQLSGCGLALEVCSFESELGVLEAGLELPPSEPPAADRQRRLWLRAGLHSVSLEQPVELGAELEEGQLQARLTLYQGDAASRLAQLPPSIRFDAVFLDPFSPAADPPLWREEFLAEIARRMAPGSWLSTYTASMAVRERLSLAGLRVGPGPRVGLKAQGTLASPDQDPGVFDRRTAAKLERRLARRRENGPQNRRSGY